MKNILKALAVIVAVGIVSFIIILKTPLLKYPVSLFLSRSLKSEVLAKKCIFGFTKGITLQDIEIKNQKGLHCFIKDAHIKVDVVSLIKGSLILDCHLKSVNFSSKSSDIANSIAALFSIEPVESLEFYAIDGIVHLTRNQMLIKDLSANGKDVSLFINGRTLDNKYVDYIFKLILSEKLTSKIPEAIRSIFFRKERDYSVVELYLKGNIKKPSINFSTPLFKLQIK